MASIAATLTGEQIAALAYALPPLEPEGLCYFVEIISIIIGVIATIVVGLRVWIRAGLSGATKRIWGVDDYLVIIGVLPFIPSIVFSVYCARFGVGRLDVDLPDPLYQVRALEYVIYWEITYFISSTIFKCAIGFACVRLDTRGRVFWPITINMGIMVIVTIMALTFIFANCTPFQAMWNPALGRCQSIIGFQTLSYIVSAVQMVTDWACALIPVFIVAGLQMPRRTKLSVVCILGLGILVSVATIVRIPYLKYCDTVKYPNDLPYHLAAIVITSNVECGLGIIACSLPPLRKLFKFYYRSCHDPNTSGQVSELRILPSDK
ncbi:uncharacterized protein BCR38DRAFT_353944 [Pseudomassariella vexata]|uniref:Rhodopsin domain-containing protein n=1 Tax=Pseudomassariella vexata TaxID=1141098 RepID=A0A1Y2DEZ9_9PEZI|nr:uncharacterized protein BCR38DRAFT_353944 [Pseudomassariella vexata]ORY57767.1 hypothetical protein BCR38DRAFT_353944 [Pseudomassariella vexata]